MTTENIISRLSEIDALIDALKAEQELLKAEAKPRVLKQTGLKKSIVGTDGTLTYVKPTESKAFDSKAFMADYPELYEQYKTATRRTKGYIKFTPKKK